MFARSLAFAALCALALMGGARAQNVVISEFMASNKHTLADEDGDFSDWLELYNPRPASASLNGWYLTDNPLVLDKWTIPNVTLPAGQFLVIFASGKNRTDPASRLHTSFKLDAGGEYLALVKPDGGTVASEYAPRFPPQQADVSYGIAFTGQQTILIPSAAPCRATVPASGSGSTGWTAASYTDTSWTAGATGVGFERSTGYESLIGLNLAKMYGVNSTAYIRVPFTLTETPSFGKMTLRMKYDDGFVAYLNGTRIASANAPGTLTSSSSATTTHDDTLAVQYVDYDVTSWLPLLTAGSNVLAIHGLNAGATSSDFLISPELIGEAGGGLVLGSARYFTSPTPGGPNGLTAADQGPTIDAVGHAPARPQNGQSLVVTARVAPQANVVASVTMYYRVNYGAVSQVAMADDGAHGDGAAEDLVYGATIPASAYGPGQMVRYYVVATDAKGLTTRHPFFANATASPEYLGTVVADPSVSSQLPVFDWFVENPAAAGTDAGTQSSVYFNGEFYDNVFTRLRGLTSTGWPKKSYKFDMNGGAYFRFDPNEERVSEINLNTSFADKAYVRVPLSWDTYADAGVPGCIARTYHVRQNGAFYCLSYYVEQPDEALLTRNHLDADGALYKMYNTGTSSTSGVEKKTRRWESNADLEALVQGVKLAGTPLRNYLCDNLDVPEALNYLAATCLVQDTDHFWTNYYLYRDTEGNGEWQIIPWDKDLTFGRMWYLDTPLNDFVRADYDTTSHPLLGDRYHTLITSGSQWNYIIDALYRDPTIKAMYLRRLRSLMDQLLQRPGTPVDERKYEKRIDAYYAQMAADVVLDRAKWGNPFGLNQDFLTGISVLKSSYLDARRVHLFVTHSVKDGLIPAAQKGNPAVQFGAIEPEPASGNQDEQYVELRNPNNVDVDISGWTLSGAVTHTFRPGTVIPALGSLYVSPNVVAFRKRAAPPTGGMGLFVQGDYSGRLSAAGNQLELRGADGALVPSDPYTLPDVARAVAIAAGLAAPDSTEYARLNVVTGGESATTVDLADAGKLLRSVCGL